MNEIATQDIIETRIHTLRGKKVMLDRDLAALYGVETGNLNKAVKRNIERFPGDLMFQLVKEELENLIFQFGRSRWGGIRKLPYAFTENGVAMLSGVLNSPRAIQVNIQIMRAFTRMRSLVADNTELRKTIENIEKRLDMHDRQIWGACFSDTTILLPKISNDRFMPCAVCTCSREKKKGHSFLSGTAVLSVFVMKTLLLYTFGEQSNHTLCL